MSVVESTNLNKIVFENIQISSLENMIIESLKTFYEDEFNNKIFISIINSNSKISIRLIDHFVTKYSKNNKITYKLKENNIEQIFSVNVSYKQQLKGFQKKHFDPFSRGDRIPYFIGDNCIITTIGQLNFFKWFISKKVYNYILLNHDIIEDDMNNKNENLNNKTFKKLSLKKPIKYNIIKTHPYSLSSNNFNQIKSNNCKSDKILVSFNFN